MQTQGVWQAGGHGKTPPDVHMGEAEVEALLDLEQYTGKVTTDRYSDSSWPFCLKSLQIKISSCRKSEETDKKLLLEVTSDYSKVNI